MTEYSGGGGGGGGICSVRSMILVDQMAMLLNQTEDVGNSASIEEAVGTIPWLKRLEGTVSRSQSQQPRRI